MTAITEISDLALEFGNQTTQIRDIDLSIRLPDVQNREEVTIITPLVVKMRERLLLFLQ
jgi:hypothetical protein